MLNTVLDVVKKGLCTGCGTCYSLCPNHSINMKIHKKKGIYIPRINERCDNCGICLKVCPGHEFDFRKFNNEIFGRLPNDSLLGNFLRCSLGYSTDEKIRYNSSSGGIVTQILISALEMGLIDGALVTRMKKDDPFIPEPFIARSKKEIIEASKSKYCPVPANIALKTILEEEEDDKKFAVVGLPCHVHGIRKAEKVNKILKKKIIMHIGIFCSTMPSFLATKFILHKYSIDKEKVKSFSYRGNGWPGCLKVKLEKNKRTIPINEYRSSGFAEYFIPIRCKLCIDMSNEFADLSIADAWIPEIIKNDNIGTSIILTKNNNAKKFLENFNSIKTVKMKPEDVIKSQDYLKKKKKYYNVFSTFHKSNPYYNTRIHNPEPIYYLDVIPYYLTKILSAKPFLWNLMIYYKNIKKLIYSGYVTRFLSKITLIR